MSCEDSTVAKLTKLKNYLVNLDPKYWVFNKFVERRNPDGIFSATDCGTVGCALGHCPNIWPDFWHYEYEFGNLTSLRDIDGNDQPDQILESAAKFFGIAVDESVETFYADCHTIKKVTKDEFIARLDTLISKYTECK